MFGIGGQELLVILLVTLVLFGGKRIPEVARALGSGLRDLRQAMQDVQREVNAESLGPPRALPPPYGKPPETLPTKPAAPADEPTGPPEEGNRAP